MKMRAIIAVTVFSVADLVAVPVFGQAAAIPAANGAAEPAPPAKPKVYALVAAVGAEFTMMFEQSHTGTNFSPFKRTSVTVKNNILNRFVLHSLDKSIEATDPGSKRIFLTLRAADMDKASPSERETIAVNEAIADFRGMPERLEWDRIILATPAYKAFSLNGVPGRIEGLGVFYQPLKGGFIFGNDLDFFGDGEEATSPDNKPIRSKRYAAPFSFIEVWVIDAKTLEVLDKTQRFDAVKLFDPFSDAQNITQNVSEEVLMKSLSSLVDRSVEAAVKRTGKLRSREAVDVGNVKEVKPDPPR
jgi:hypothetical protein